MTAGPHSRPAAVPPEPAAGPGSPGADPREPVLRLLRDLRTSGSGLSATEAARRLVVVGPNELARTAHRSWWRELVTQVVHPLALLLWLAAALAAGTGSTTLAVAIVAVVLLNAGFAFWQESQAERAFAARTEWASLRSIGLFSNRLLLLGILGELLFTAGVVYWPPAQQLFGTAALPGWVLLLLLPFPVVVWGADEVLRWARRLPRSTPISRRAARRTPRASGHGPAAGR